MRLKTIGSAFGPRWNTKTSPWALVATADTRPNFRQWTHLGATQNIFITPRDECWVITHRNNIENITYDTLAGRIMRTDLPTGKIFLLVSAVALRVHTTAPVRVSMSPKCAAGVFVGMGDGTGGETGASSQGRRLSASPKT